MLPKQVPGGPHGIGGDEAIEHDPAGLAAHKRRLSKVEAANLIDARNDLIKTVIVVELADAMHRRMYRVEFVFLVEELKLRHVPGNAAGFVADLHLGHPGDEAPPQFVEITGVVKGEGSLRLPQHLLGELRGSLSLGVEVPGRRRHRTLGGRSGIALKGHVRRHGKGGKTLHELTSGGHETGVPGVRLACVGDMRQDTTAGRGGTMTGSRLIPASPEDADP